MSYFPSPPPAPPPAQNNLTRFCNTRGRSRNSVHPRGDYQEGAKGPYRGGPSGTGEHSNYRNGASCQYVEEYGQMRRHPYSHLSSRTISGKDQFDISHAPLPSAKERLISQDPPASSRYGSNSNRVQAEANQPNQRARQQAQAREYGNELGPPRPFESNWPTHGFQHQLSNAHGRGQNQGRSEVFRHKGRIHNFRNIQTDSALPNPSTTLHALARPVDSQIEKKRPQKDKDKRNTLGLTPGADDRESNDDEEDDEGEEAKLAVDSPVSSRNYGQHLQIVHKGRTLVLRTSADIVAWLEERRRNFPTQARAAEAAQKKQQCDGARKAAQQALITSRKKALSGAMETRTHKADEKKRKAIERDRSANHDQISSVVAATKVKREIKGSNESRARGERRANGEPDAAETGLANKARNVVQNFGRDKSSQSRQRNRSASQSSTEQSLDKSSMNGKTSSTLRWPAVQDTSHRTSTTRDTPMSTSHISGNQAFRSPHGQGAVSVDLQDGASSTISSPTLSMDTDDWTSSSGSDSSESEEPPEETITKMDGPELPQPPPKRPEINRVCKYFLRNGQCRSGRRCKFKHETSERGSRTTRVGKPSSQQVHRTARISLYQRLVLQEKMAEESAAREAKVDHGKPISSTTIAKKL